MARKASQNGFDTPAKAGKAYPGFSSGQQNTYQDSTAYTSHREAHYQVAQITASKFLFRDDDFEQQLDEAEEQPLRLAKQ